MEIDFLGLNSKYSPYNLMTNDQNSTVNPFTGIGVDVSLCLGTTSPLDSQTDELPYPHKVGGCTKIVDNSSPDKARECNRGYTPTVAMARRATLARFLQKRSHRLTQTRAAHVSSKLLTSKACNNKKNRSSFVVGRTTGLTRAYI